MSDLLNALKEPLGPKRTQMFMNLGFDRAAAVTMQLYEKQEKEKRRMNESTSAKFPEYVCHKRVRAAKIQSITVVGIADGRYMLGFDGLSQCVTPEWKTRHKPEVGGYYVVYGIGTPEQYESYSPAKAFEEGYILADIPCCDGNVTESNASPSIEQVTLHSKSPFMPASPGKLVRIAARWLTNQLIKHGHDFDIGTVEVSLTEFKMEGPGKVLMKCKSDVQQRRKEFNDPAFGVVDKQVDELPTYDEHPLYPPVVPSIVPPSVPASPKPSIGRIVHYRGLNGTVYPAIIKWLNLNMHGEVDSVNLAVFGEFDLNSITYIEKGEQQAPGCWSWPERS